MTAFLIPFLWILFIVNPKLMTFLVALTFTVGHVGVLIAMDGEHKRLGWLLTAIGFAGFVCCFTVYPCERLDI